MFDRLLHLLFPPKCILCRRVLQDQQTDLCGSCRQSVREFTGPKKKYSFIAGWTALWYYEDAVRESMKQFKFYNHPSYADSYGRLLAMHLMKEDMLDFEILTWVPVSAKRKWQRGYDQVELIAKAVAKELSVTAQPTLCKHRHAPPQSGIRDAAARRANIQGAYRALDPSRLQGKRILLLDDIVTTGESMLGCVKALKGRYGGEIVAVSLARTPKKRTY